MRSAPRRLPPCSNVFRGDRTDFVYTVSRDFVRQCQTPVLVLPDDMPDHPYVVAIESVYLAPNAQVTLYPWKANPKQTQIALRHVRGFLRENPRPQRRCRLLPPPSSARGIGFGPAGRRGLRPASRSR